MMIKETATATLTTDTQEGTADIPQANTEHGPAAAPEPCLTQEELQDIAQFVDSDLLALLGQC